MAAAGRDFGGFGARDLGLMPRRASLAKFSLDSLGAVATSRGASAQQKPVLRSTFVAWRAIARVEMKNHFAIRDRSPWAVSAGSKSGV